MKPTAFSHTQSASLFPSVPYIAGFWFRLSRCPFWKSSSSRTSQSRLYRKPVLAGICLKASRYFSVASLSSDAVSLCRGTLYFKTFQETVKPPLVKLKIFGYRWCQWSVLVAVLQYLLFRLLCRNAGIISALSRG